VGVGATAAISLPLAACASLATVRVAPENGVLRVPIRNYPQLDRPGGQLRVAAEGGGRPIYLLGQPDGSFLALSSECTHLKCTVELEGARIVCPCHGSTYDRAGQVLVGPAERPLDRYATRLRDDGVLEIVL
jgi:Rieske Fe-S protein